MPVNVRLSDDQTHLIYDLSDPLDINQLLAGYNQEQSLRDSIPHTVHSIVDMSNVRSIPPNWLTAKAGPGLKHPRSGVILFVGLSRSLRMIVDVILKITRYNRMQFFDTREEAEAFLYKLLEEEKASK